MAVPVVPLTPTVATATAEAAKATADRMAADVVVARGKDTWTIAGTSLAPLISFSTAADGSITPVLDEAGLDPMLKTLAPKVKQTVRDASLKMVNGHVVATGTSREGRTLKIPETKAAIVSEIGARQAGAAATPVEAVVKAVDPKLTTADAKAFAPKMKVISSYSVYYWVIVNNHWGGNIEGPATVINGTVVPAGTKFDFWKVVGDLHDAPGTGPGNAIEGGKITVTGAFGGGICTTSTTLFNAAFRAGMVPLARQNHNEFIDRYPPGLDATVWIVGKTKQTMSFRNDTKYPILITRTDHPRRQQAMAHVQDLERAEPPDLQDQQPGHHPRPGARINTIVQDPTKPVGYRYFNNAAGGRRQGVGHRVDLRPRQAPLAEALLLELPGGQRRHHRGDGDQESDLTPACSSAGARQASASVGAAVRLRASGRVGEASHSPPPSRRESPTACTRLYARPMEREHQFRAGRQCRR